MIVKMRYAYFKYCTIFFYIWLQIVQESIPIPGSGLHLTYQSSSAAGYLSAVRMLLTGPRIPSTLTHVHVGVEIEGSLHVKTYEADPDLTHTFAWSKRNVYKQKVCIKIDNLLPVSPIHGIHMTTIGDIHCSHLLFNIYHSV